MLLSLVLPCYNPPPHWAQDLHSRFEEFRRSIPVDVEVIIVLDGRSEQVKDADVSFLKENQQQADIISYNTNKGKGHALRKGIEASKGDIIIYTDIDFPYTIASMVEIFTALQNNSCDLAAGIKNEDYYKNVPPARRFVSRTLRQFIGIFISIPFNDTQCGLKGFTKAVKPVFLATTINRYLFDLEFIRAAYKAKFRVLPLPVALREGIFFRKMNYKILFSEGFSFIKILLKR